jgi:hypothetical protein
MTKKGPLSKAERFYIENNRGLTVGDLCKDLDRAKNTIQKYIKTLPEVEAAPVAKDSPVASTKSNETLGLQQFARNGKGSTVMTPNASELGDSFKKVGPTARAGRCTTTIRQENG